MRKIIALIIICALLVAMCACGNGGEQSEAEASSSYSSASAEAASSTNESHAGASSDHTISDAVSDELTEASSETSAETSSDDESGDASDTPSDDVSDTPVITPPPAGDFSLTSADGNVKYDAKNNIYTLSSAGTYACSGVLENGQIKVEAPDDAVVVIELSGCSISCTTSSPIYILTAKKVEISAKKETSNIIRDLRKPSQDDEEAEGSAAIYAECDLTLKGNGSLEVAADMNNGVHTKDDLKIKNLTLKVTAVNNALKGNDSLSIESGNITAISTSGDALKTTSTDLNKNGEQRGAITLSGGKVKLYSACDGIDSASDAVITGDCELEIYTDSYSPYSGDPMSVGTSKIYLRISNTLFGYGYKYSAYFYKTDGTYKWVDLNNYIQVSGGGPGGFPGRPGGGPGSKTGYYYFLINVPAGFTNVKFYAYSVSQQQGQNENYIAVTNAYTALPDARDTYAVSGISGGVITSSGWTNYQSASGNGALDHSCKGIKAANRIIIEGGSITVKSKDDGMHANSDELLESTGKKGLGNISVTGGSINIYSDDDAMHADQDISISGGNISITNSYEAVEANRIYISGGSIIAYAKDDGLNANSKGASR